MPAAESAKTKPHSPASLSAMVSSPSLVTVEEQREIRVQNRGQMADDRKRQASAALEQQRMIKNRLTPAELVATACP